MNIKSMIAAAAVAASTVASASIFNWTITANEGSTLTKGSITSGTRIDGEETGLRGGPEWTANGSSVSGTLEAGNWTYKYGENGNLQGYAVWAGEENNGKWWDVSKFSFYITGETTAGTEKSGGTDILWSDVLTAWRGGKAYSKTFWYGGDNGDALSGTISITPEPTSGLMLLLGAGMLALRRKAVRA